MRKPSNRIQKNATEVVDYREQVFKLWAKGLTLEKIGEKVKKHYSTISLHIKKHKNEDVYKYAEQARKDMQTLVDKRMCQNDGCVKELTKTYQKKFCSHKCSNTGRNATNWWPMWIKNEKNEKVCTGRAYKDYVENTRDKKGNDSRDRVV